MGTSALAALSSVQLPNFLQLISGGRWWTTKNFCLNLEVKWGWVLVEKEGGEVGFDCQTEWVKRKEEERGAKRTSYCIFSFLAFSFLLKRNCWTNRAEISIPDKNWPMIFNGVHFKLLKREFYCHIFPLFKKYKHMHKHICPYYCKRWLACFMRYVERSVVAKNIKLQSSLTFCVLDTVLSLSLSLSPFSQLQLRSAK